MSNESDLLKLIGLRKTDDPWVFEGVSLPERSGNLRPIAYGGCAIGTAVNAASQTVPENAAHMVPYSISGNFLGPASTDSTFTCVVTPLRDTRSFVTRQVVVKQQTKKGDMRNCLALTVDMIASPFSTRAALAKAREQGKNPATLQSIMQYQLKPPANFAVGPDEIDPPTVAMGKKCEEYGLPKTVDETLVKMSEFWTKNFDTRGGRDSMIHDTLFGILDAPHPQDKLGVTERRASDWIRAKQHIPKTEGNGDEYTTPNAPGMLRMSANMAQAAIMTLAMDSSLPFLPLSVVKKPIMEASAASTLEFAMRFHTDMLDFNRWHFREMRPIMAGWSRSFSESLLWDDAGNLVASNTQQAVLRPMDVDATPKL